MQVGLGLEVVASIPSFFLRDKYALGDENDADLNDDDDNDNVHGAGAGAGADKPTSADDRGNVTESKHNGIPPHGDGVEAAESDERTALLSRSPSRTPSTRVRTSRGCIRKKHIPYVMFISGLFVSLGSGMTVKFFPLFFKVSATMTPACACLNAHARVCVCHEPGLSTSTCEFAHDRL